MQKKRLWWYHRWKLWKLLKAAANNEYVGDLPWYIGVKFTGQDDNTSVPVSNSVSIAAISHSNVQAILEEKAEVEAD